MENEQKQPVSNVIEFPSDVDTSDDGLPESATPDTKEPATAGKEEPTAVPPCDLTQTLKEATEAAETDRVTNNDIVDRNGQPVTNTVTLAKRNVERIILVEWLFLTDAERVERGLPRTQRDLAKRMGVSEFMLSKWKAEKGFQAEQRARLAGRAIGQAGRILDHLADKAVGKTKDGCNEAAKMILDIALPKANPDIALSVNLNEIVSSDLEKPGALPEWARRVEGEVVARESDSFKPE